MFLSRPAVLLDAVVTFNKNNTKREKIFYLIITNTYIYIYTHSYFITLLLDKTLYTFTPCPHHVRVACRNANNAVQLVNTARKSVSLTSCSYFLRHRSRVFVKLYFSLVALKKTSSNVVSVMPQSFIFSASALISITLNTLARSTSPRGISYV